MFRVRTRLEQILFPVVLQLRVQPKIKSWKNFNTLENGSDKSKSKLIICVVGGPGSGKGTQCKKLSAKFGFSHISSGELLRAEVDSGSAKGHKFQDLMEAGELVPCADVLELIRQNVNKLKHSSGLLIDGYPRQMDQIKDFENEIGLCTMVLWFDCKREAMIRRLLKRGKAGGRGDDLSIDTINRRLLTFVQSTEPVLDFYERRNKVRRVDAEKSLDDVFRQIENILMEVM